MGSGLSDPRRDGTHQKRKNLYQESVSRTGHKLCNSTRDLVDCTYRTNVHSEVSVARSRRFIICLVKQSVPLLRLDKLTQENKSGIRAANPCHLQTFKEEDFSPVIPYVLHQRD